MTEPVLEAVDVAKHFAVANSVGDSSVVRAVEGASIRLEPGRITAVVGESGSGKTTLARILARFYEPTSGEIRLDGVPVAGDGIRKKAVQKSYRKAVQLIFQDPFGSLNPLHRVRHNLERAVRLHHGRLSRTEVDQRLASLLERVSLTPASDYLDKFPHELSGGQRQRVVIARALAVEPRVLLGDEPISMLDVSIRLEMLNLLDKLRREDGLALLYITHDIASARYLCDDIVVMYAGQMVEAGPKDAVISNPQHPYTKLLVESSPDPHRDTAADRDDIFGSADELGEPPSLIDPPTGCRFHPRCPFAMEKCRTTAPPRAQLPDGRWADCWLHEEGRADELAHTTMTERITRKLTEDPR
ncbi:peptide/nickel transport system ATP-binding protein [Labedella gwakjiensis]|uniref:ABC transporter ATP-binding protein n=1 Tax=Labedella gwakjiensis TaxID=390269 RepID=A0A2P8GUJ7_9MICO|nr:ABC transporter ATP-binding protein [Labedella gwakjiensis]PSL37638.1 peptide/nickel transport system ATP-binding protein [Labedella gwakjiensis]RUQ87765.1 ABC transporter ATP-binding protein [Labedella gwakjiensis]